MKILMLPSSYFPETLGGTETYVHSLAEPLSKRGNRVCVAYHQNPLAKIGHTLAQHDYQIAQLEPLKKPTRAELYSSSLGEDPSDFIKLLEDTQPDIIHFHANTLGAGLDHARVASRFGMPYVVTYHTPAMSCLRGTLMYFGREACQGQIKEDLCAPCVLHSRGLPRYVSYLVGRNPIDIESLPDFMGIYYLGMRTIVSKYRGHWLEFMDKAAHIVACAKWCREVLMANGISPKKISVLRQAIPGRTRQRILRLPLPRHRQIVLGFLGRFTPVKAPEKVIEAVVTLRKRGVEAICHLVGPILDGDKPWAEALIGKTKGLSVYQGVKRGEALSQWLRQIDVLVIPGHWMETGPLNLLEAWDHGTPVIGIRRGGIQESLTEENLEALLFDSEEVEEGIANAVERALEWSHSHRVMVTIPGSEHLVDSMLSVYESAVRTKLLTGRAGL